MNKRTPSDGQATLFPDYAPGSEQLGQDKAKDILDREGIKYVYIRTTGDARNAVSELVRADVALGFDTETARLPKFKDHSQAGLEPHLSCIRLVQVYGGGPRVFIFDMDHIEVRDLTPIWERPLVAHNAVFDLKHLIHGGVQPKRLGCTMLMANALSGRLPSLAGLSRQYLGWKVAKELQTSDWSAPVLTDEQLCYAALDAVAVFKLFPILEQALAEKDLLPVYRLMRDAQTAVAKMELNGVYFDLEGHRRLMAEWTLEKETAEKELMEMLGTGFNPSSGKQLSDWLQINLDSKALEQWPKTATGQLRTSGSVFSQFQALPIVKPLQRHKDASKLLSTYGEGFTSHINPKTGRIHARFRLGGTYSGRFSCSEPNVQNPPRLKRFRALFGAPPGRVIVVADYSQIELRVAAVVSGDKNMLEAYAKGEDLHRKTASAIAGVAPEKVTKEQRQAAKAVNFGLLYGQGAKGLARYAKASYGVDMSEEDAQKAREAFFWAYPGLREWQRQTGRNTELTKQVRTPGGRLRHFSKDYGGYQFAEALNTPIQGGAAEVLLATLAKLEVHMKGLDAKLVNLIHDEIVLEVAEKDAQAAKRALEKAMTEGMLAIFPNATTVGLVEAGIGPNWAEAK